LLKGLAVDPAFKLPWQSEGSGNLVSEGDIGNVAIGKTAHESIKDLFKGTIDEVAIFDVALSKDQIKSIKNSGLLKGLAVDPAFKLPWKWGQIRKSHGF